MGKRKKMYSLLEKMIEKADARDLKAVEYLMKKYDGLAEGVYSDPWSPIDLLYGKCKTDILNSFEFSGICHLLVESARQTRSKIPVPGDNE